MELLCFTARFRSFFDYNNNSGWWCCNLPRTTSLYMARRQCNNNCLFSVTSESCVVLLHGPSSVGSWELFKVKVFRKTLPKDEELLGKNFIAFAVLGSPIWFYTVGDRGFSFWWLAGWLAVLSPKTLPQPPSKPYLNLIPSQRGREYNFKYRSSVFTLQLSKLFLQL